MLEAGDEVGFDVVQQLRVCRWCLGVRRGLERQRRDGMAELEEISRRLVRSDPFARVPNPTRLGAAESANPSVPGRFDRVLDLEHVWQWEAAVRRVFDFGQAVGQQHLDVPVAAEVAVAFQSVDVLNALVAEVCDGDVRVGRAEVC